jgi:hypothetical protein
VNFLTTSFRFSSRQLASQRSWKDETCPQQSLWSIEACVAFVKNRNFKIFKKASALASGYRALSCRPYLCSCQPNIIILGFPWFPGHIE